MWRRLKKPERIIKKRKSMCGVAHTWIFCLLIITEYIEVAKKLRQLSV